MIIIKRFGKNNALCPKCIDIYKFWGGYVGDERGTLYIFCLLLKKNGKSIRA